MQTLNEAWDFIDSACGYIDDCRNAEQNGFSQEDLDSHLEEAYQCASQARSILNDWGYSQGDTEE